MRGIVQLSWSISKPLGRSSRLDCREVACRAQRDLKRLGGTHALLAGRGLGGLRDKTGEIPSIQQRLSLSGLVLAGGSSSRPNGYYSLGCTENPRTFSIPDRRHFQMALPERSLTEPGLKQPVSRGDGRSGLLGGLWAIGRG